MTPAAIAEAIQKLLEKLKNGNQVQKRDALLEFENNIIGVVRVDHTGLIISSNQTIIHNADAVISLLVGNKHRRGLLAVCGEHNGKKFSACYTLCCTFSHKV